MKKLLAPAIVAALVAGCAGLPPELSGILGETGGAQVVGPLSESEIAAGLKEALATGTQRAIGRVGVRDGFWMNRDITIPLPDNLRKAERALRAIGQGTTVDEFHLSLNRAAEAAVPEAAAIFGTAIRAMTLDDARRILGGPADAATEYFRGKTQAHLAARFEPIVMQATNRVGATRKYKDLVTRMKAYVPGAQAQDLDAYVTDRALSGLFKTLAEEEYRIRQDPAARTSELLRKVFGAYPR